MPCSGVVAQLVRASACHAEGRGFEPLQSRQINKKHIRNDVFFYLACSGIVFMGREPEQRVRVQSWQEQAQRFARRSRLTRRKGPTAISGGNLQPLQSRQINKKHIRNDVFF